ncbi:hypothetical protein ACFUEM_39240 [Streptomyces anulatus]|uniref:hypothetical protein n=1 Tax=Streptomyces anulatus TaxID=1892 RepID=UPI0035E2CA0B
MAPPAPDVNNIPEICSPRPRGWSQQEIVERLVANYRTLLQLVDVGGPAQSARGRRPPR